MVIQSFGQLNIESKKYNFSDIKLWDDGYIVEHYTSSLFSSWNSLIGYYDRNGEAKWIKEFDGLGRTRFLKNEKSKFAYLINSTVDRENDQLLGGIQVSKEGVIKKFKLTYKKHFSELFDIDWISVDYISNTENGLTGVVKMDNRKNSYVEYGAFRINEDLSIEVKKLDIRLSREEFIADNKSYLNYKSTPDGLLIIQMDKVKNTIHFNMDVMNFKTLEIDHSIVNHYILDMNQGSFLPSKKNQIDNNFELYFSPVTLGLNSFFNFDFVDGQLYGFGSILSGKSIVSKGSEYEGSYNLEGLFSFKLSLDEEIEITKKDRAIINLNPKKTGKTLSYTFGVVKGKFNCSLKTSKGTFVFSNSSTPKKVKFKQETSELSFLSCDKKMDDQLLFISKYTKPYEIIENEYEYLICYKNKKKVIIYKLRK